MFMIKLQAFQSGNQSDNSNVRLWANTNYAKYGIALKFELLYHSSESS